MGFRFQKSISFFPGIRLNLSKSGASVTVGKPGLSVNLGKDGATGNVGIPGTGLSSREKIGWWGLIDLAIKEVVKTEGFYVHRNP